MLYRRSLMRLKFNQRKFAAVLAGLFLVSGDFARLLARPEPQKEITVSAAISLKDVLDEIATVYRTDVPDTVIHFNLGASGTLQRQIEEGAPVDVFISASKDQMDSLESHGLVLA